MQALLSGVYAGVFFIGRRLFFFFKQHGFSLFGALFGLRLFLQATCSLVGRSKRRELFCFGVPKPMRISESTFGRCFLFFFLFFRESRNL